MDLDTKRCIAVATLVFMDVLFRMVLAALARLVTTAAGLHRWARKRRRNDDEDDGDLKHLMEGGAVCFGLRRRRHFWCALRSPGVWEDEIIQN